MGFPAGLELLVIFFIAVILFGEDKIPKIARASGQAISEFNKGRERIQKENKESAEESKTISEGNPENN